MSNLKLKVSPIHIFRRVIQIIFFIFLPGIFTTAFYAIKEVYVAIINQSFTLSTYIGSILTILAVILPTIFLGRFFCGFLCSFGAMGDFLWFLSKKTIKSKFRPSEPLDAGLKWVKYGLLLYIVVVFWTLNLIALDSTASPWTIFGMYASLDGWPAAKYLLSLGGLMLLLIMAGSLFIERFFCRYLCPLGAIFAVVSKLRLFHIHKNRDHCKSCRLCTNNCAMGIPLYQYDKITSGECINCFACMEGCPQKNVKTNTAPAVASAASVAAITGLVYAGNIASAGITSSSDNTNFVTAENAAIGQYTDGTYTGTGTGFKGETEVAVTVENGSITDITAVSYEDDREYFERAEGTIISEIIEAQDVDVDAVSGATFSSNGISAAVADALGISDTNGTNNTLSGKSTVVQSFTDGTYTGTGTGFRGETEVSVTVENGKIADITVVAYKDDEQYFSRAESTVISEIIEAQDVDVDAVSGATFSSNGLMEAVADALGISYTNENSTLRSGYGRGRH
jgi:uncharacterized protein with FMN-binding domain